VTLRNTNNDQALHAMRTVFPHPKETVLALVDFPEHPIWDFQGDYGVDAFEAHDRPSPY
jgi:hypothetical protein